jgi:hypothetical protein
MTWQANLDEIKYGDNYIIVRATLSDGTQKVRPDEYRVNSELELKQKISADVARLTAIKTELPKLATGPYDFAIKPPVPPVIEPPTSEELARSKFMSDLVLQRQMELAIKLELKTGADKDYLDQVDLVKQEFKPDYVSLLGIL